MKRLFSCQALILNIKYEFKMKMRGFNAISSRTDFILVPLNASDDLKKISVVNKCFAGEYFQHACHVRQILLMYGNLKKMVFFPCHPSIPLILFKPLLPLSLFFVIESLRFALNGFCFHIYHHYSPNATEYCLIRCK